MEAGSLSAASGPTRELEISKARAGFDQMEPFAPERFLHRGQERGEARIGQYGRAPRRTHGQKAPGPCGLRSRGRPPRCGARPMYPHRPSRRALRIAAREPQRKLIPSGRNLL